MKLGFSLTRGGAAVLLVGIALIAIAGFGVAYNPNFNPDGWDGSPRSNPSPEEFGHTADEIYGLKEAFCMVGDTRPGCQGSGGGTECTYLEVLDLDSLSGDYSKFYFLGLGDSGKQLLYQGDGAKRAPPEDLIGIALACHEMGEYVCSEHRLYGGTSSGKIYEFSNNNWMNIKSLSPGFIADFFSAEETSVGADKVIVFTFAKKSTGDFKQTVKSSTFSSPSTGTLGAFRDAKFGNNNGTAYYDYAAVFADSSGVVKKMDTDGTVWDVGFPHGNVKLIDGSAYVYTESEVDKVAMECSVSSHKDDGVVDGLSTCTDSSSPDATLSIFTAVSSEVFGAVSSSNSVHIRGSDGTWSAMNPPVLSCDSTGTGTGSTASGGAGRIMGAYTSDAIGCKATGVAAGAPSSCHCPTTYDTMPPTAWKDEFTSDVFYCITKE